MKEIRLSFTTVLLIIFIVLKLVGSIAWSWWWVLSPLWIPTALWVVMLMILLSAKMIVKLLTRNDNKWADYPREYHQWTSVRERREGKWGKYSTPKKRTITMAKLNSKQTKIKHRFGAFEIRISGQLPTVETRGLERQSSHRLSRLGLNS